MFSIQRLWDKCKNVKSDISLIFLIVLLYFKTFKHILYLFWASQMWNAKFDAFVSTFLPLVFFEVYLYPPGVLTGNLYHKSNTMPHAQISKNIFDHAWNVKLKVAFDEQNMCRPLSWWNILTRKDKELLQKWFLTTHAFKIKGCFWRKKYVSPIILKKYCISKKGNNSFKNGLIKMSLWYAVLHTEINKQIIF
jgi:hypothetical protein